MRGHAAELHRDVVDRGDIEPGGLIDPEGDSLVRNRLRAHLHFLQRRAAGLAQRLLEGAGLGEAAARATDSHAWLALIRSHAWRFPEVLKWVSTFALAINEENANLGRVVTAPTNGAAGVIPAVLLYHVCFAEEAPTMDAIADFLLVAGETGTFFKKGATISAAMLLAMSLTACGQNDDEDAAAGDTGAENGDLITNTEGRPLGLDMAPDGTLVVADGYRGLLRVNPASGGLTVLTDQANGVPFGFTDDVDVASDGVIYFTDASSKFGPAMKARDDIMEHGGHGRFLKYDPESATTTVLMEGLQFANGVALSENEDFVLVTQTGSYNVLRYWLKGDKAGSHDVFFDNLPGIPDGISGNGRGTFWLALFAPRNAALDAMSDKPLLRKVVFRLPQFMQPQPARHGFVLGLDESGAVTANLQHLGEDAFAPVTSAEQAGERLYLGSLTRDSFAVYPLSDDRESLP